MHRKTYILFLIALFAFCNGANASGATKLSDDLNSAVIYAYFGVNDDDTQSPSISIENFKSQISDIADKLNGYNPISLDSILRAQDKNSPLPEKTISLTFEGTDKSFLRNALPLLKENGIPFALFISPGRIDQGERINDPSVLTWDDIRKIADSDLATIGMTSYSYTHISSKRSLESLISDTNRARERIREELGIEPRYFSYPYGEYTPNFIKAISKQGFVAAFGQQSGAMGKSSSRVALPRFTMTDNFSDLDRLRLTALSLPFPVVDTELGTTVIESNPPTPGFTVRHDVAASDLKKIKCFASGIEKLDVQRIGERRFEIRFSNGFEDSKGRLNCTIPVAPIEGTDDPRWRWLGFQFTVPDGA